MARWGAALICMWSLGCSTDAETEQPPPPVMVSSGGSVEPGSNAARAERGTVTLLGANARIAYGSWNFSGSPEGSATGEDEVSCFLGARGGTRTLNVSARKADAAAPGASFTLEVEELAAAEMELSYRGGAAERLEASVAMSLDGLDYFYDYGADGVAVASACTATVIKLSEQWATGQLACRDLIPSSRSADAPVAGTSPRKASATIAFDCPIQVTSSPEPGGSTGGSGSSGEGGRGNGGSSSGGGSGAAGSSGNGGSAGSEPIVKSCHGATLSCSSLTSSTCYTVRGCSPSGECTGVASGCYSQYYSYSCTSQQGCYWSSLSDSCSGSARSCRLFSGSSSCVSQKGCYWNDTCEGVATSCVLLGEFDCELQPGCSWY